jgi:hypothetical protein
MITRQNRTKNVKNHENHKKQSIKATMTKLSCTVLVFSVPSILSLLSPVLASPAAATFNTRSTLPF